MEKKLRLFLTTSSIAVSVAACAPNNSPLNSLPPTQSTPVVNTPVTNRPLINAPANVNSGGIVTHSHGGKVHAHRLPANGLNHTHAIGGGRPTQPVARPPAPAPVIRQPNPVVNRNAPVSHSHGGKVHSHRLPGTGLSHTHAIGAAPRPPQRPQQRPPQPPQRPVAPAVNRPRPQPPRPAAPVRRPAVNPGNNNGGVRHSHCGRAHSHPLPRQGTHNHNNVNCAGGTPQRPPARPQQPARPRPPAPVNRPQPPATNSTYSYYDNASANTPAPNPRPNPPAPNRPQPPATTNNSYYDYTSSTNNTNTSSTNNFSNQARPKPSINYAAGSNNPPPTTNYDYSASSTPANNSTAPVSADSTYLVKRGDTVFQVMRNTGVYWKDIIRLNNLEAPNYQINPGQQLRLR